jgi:hypothetical protein
MDADRPKKLGERVMGAPRSFKETSLKNHILYVIMYKKVMEALYAKITN